MLSYIPAVEEHTCTVAAPSSSVGFRIVSVWRPGKAQSRRYRHRQPLTTASAARDQGRGKRRSCASTAPPCLTAPPRGCLHDYRLGAPLVSSLRSRALGSEWGCQETWTKAGEHAGSWQPGTGTAGTHECCRTPCPQ